MPGSLAAAPTVVADTVAHALDRTVVRLRDAGSESPRLEAELLLGHVLGLSRAQVIAAAHRSLSPDEQRTLEALVKRRLAREPLPYLLGHWEFYGLDFLVDARVLIPRPETEHLVERAIEFIRAARIVMPTLCDVGTGSGCIAVALAHHLPQARVVAIDLSTAALALAEENARRHRVQARITFVQGDLLEPLPERVHLIAANLPYVAAGEWATLPPEVARYEPRRALDGGPDGLDAIRRLLAQTPGRLHDGGLLLLEVGAGQAGQVQDMAQAAFPYATIAIIHDYAGHARIVQVQT